MVTRQMEKLVHFISFYSEGDEKVLEEEFLRASFVKLFFFFFLIQQYVGLHKK